MATSSLPSTTRTVMAAPMPRKEFPDAQIPAKYRHGFWNLKIKGLLSGKHINGTLLQLASWPECTRVIYQKYHSFCTKYAPKNVTTDLQIAVPPELAITSTSSDSTTLTCVCEKAITAADNGLCDDCWIYFTVFAKACSIEHEQQAAVAVQAPASTAPVSETATTTTLTSIETSPSALPQHPSLQVNTNMKKELPSTPPRSKPADNVNVIDLTSPSTAPAPPSRTQMPTPDHTPEAAKSKGGKPLQMCVTCDRQFPVNLKKNDGVNCTPCCNRKKKAAAEAKTKKEAAEASFEAANLSVPTPKATREYALPTPPSLSAPKGIECAVSAPLSVPITGMIPEYSVPTPQSCFKSNGTLDPRMLSLSQPMSPMLYQPSELYEGSMLDPFGSLAGSSLLESSLIRDLSISPSPVTPTKVTFGAAKPQKRKRAVQSAADNEATKRRKL